MRQSQVENEKEDLKSKGAPQLGSKAALDWHLGCHPLEGEDLDLV